jgi:hypothetical protein
MPEPIITEMPADAEPIIIDGCLVPAIVYSRVKAKARELGRTQFIGVVYLQPEELKPKPFEKLWDWGKIMQRNAARSEHMRTGQHLVYVLDQTRDQLLSRDDIVQINWITPFGD